MRSVGNESLKWFGVAAFAFVAIGWLATGRSFAQESPDALGADNTLADPSRMPLSTPERAVARPGAMQRQPARVAPRQVTPPQPALPAAPTDMMPPGTTPPVETQPSGPPPQVEFESVEYKFGKIESGKELKHTFKAKNVGEGVLKVLNVHPTCGCTVATGWAKEVPPGGSWELNVVVRTTGFNGPVVKTVVVTTNDPKKQNVELRLTGEIIARFKYEPQQMFHFGRIEKDTASTKTTKVTSQLEPLTKLTGAKVVPPEGFKAEIKELPDGKSWEINVSTVPPLKEGANQAMVELSTDSKEEPVVRLPVYAQIPPRIEILPTSLQLPQSIVRQQIRTVTFRNNSKDAIQVISVKPSDPAIKADVKKSQQGDFYTIMLTFPEGMQVPAQGGSVTILTDDKISAQYTVPIQLLPGRPIGPPQVPGGAPANRPPVAVSTRPAMGVVK